jgi:hypothetical protein
MKNLLKHPWVWSIPSLAVIVAAALAVLYIVETFPHDATLRWTAIAAVLTAAALLVAASAFRWRYTSSWNSIEISFDLISSGPD